MHNSAWVWRPCNVGIERRHLRIEFLVSANERILADLPDLTVVVPCRQVVGQVLSVVRHAGSYLPLNLLDLRVPRDQLVDRLFSHQSEIQHKWRHATNYNFPFSFKQSISSEFHQLNQVPKVWVRYSQGP